MLRRGAVFAGFVIERELGRGGMGAVYAARDRRLPRLTALKLMHRDLFADFEIRARFEREADLVAQLDHPNIITVYDRGLDEERLWIAMQFVDGVDAAAVPVQQFGSGRIAQIVTQTASALDYAHRQGVLHRDVKPANILLSHTAGVGAGFDERVVLTDFGIAKLLDDTGGLTRTGQFTATIAYASPEQLSSAPLDGRGDQYSLACTVFRLLTGTGPFDAPNPATVMLGHLNAPPPAASTRRAALPTAVDTVLSKAMAKDPTHRFPTCTAFALALTEALRHPARSAATPIHTEQPPRTAAYSTGAAPATELRPTATSSPAFPPHPVAEAAPPEGPSRLSAARRHDPTAVRHTAAAPDSRPAGAPRDPAAHPPMDTVSRDQWRSAVRHGEPGNAARKAVGVEMWAQRVHGCLLGGAIGDALGAPVETRSLQQIRAEYGSAGVTDIAPLRISEETQLTAFTVEALIKGSVRARSKGIGGATLGLLQQGMLVWLRGQVSELPDQPFALRSALSGYPELTEQRGVANSVYTALRRAAERRAPTDPLGTRDKPINNSKGSGGVMRAAPCGFGYAADRSGTATDAIFELGCDAAALTHGHPSGWLPAGSLSALVYQLARGADLATALSHTRAELARYPEHEETSAAINAAHRLATRIERERRYPTAEDVESLGQGWIGPEALSIAVFATLAAEGLGGAPHDIVRTGLLLSVNHSGDSDATGSIAGSLLGARYGHSALPRRWANAIDARPVLELLADGYCTEFGLTPPSDSFGVPPDDWWNRYPGWAPSS
ncbi:ADP-ribosylglycohydrolase family protein [Nocardia fluminea]|uniref:non-specific serine/threonine protein kinase n=1 Tax=Nocardia fluminea TaxID=134984 RepID=A0A2N3VEF9_9NOCA|nr:ADP-ribosylglycohydrolase family protein [Nocardia fluminea]PKV79976.1 serine/threonine protein kinase [Nocardia fluminea]